MIIISPYAKPLRNGRNNPKNYPYWKDLIRIMGDEEPIVQVGTKDEPRLVEDFRADLSMEDLKNLVASARTWVSVDSFFQHFCWDIGKPGIVLWGQSDPVIFGHPENKNLLVSRSFLRPNQFLWWEDEIYKEEAFVKPEIVLSWINN